MADRSVTIRLRANIAAYQRDMARAGASTSAFVKQLDTADSRMSNIVQTSLALGPALAPIGATAVPVVTSLATQLGFAAAAAGVAVAAFNGTGEALDALNEYQLNPTAENLAKLNETMAKLPASSREFVTFLDGEVLPALDRLQDAAADGVIPGATDYIEGLMTRLPMVRDLVDEIATVSGELLSEGGADIASGRWDDFMVFLTDEARPNLEALATTAANTGEGVANALMGLDPITDMVTEGIVGLSEKFAAMDPSEYEGFVDYVTRVGPQVADTIGAIGGALGAIVQAAAPVGEVALPAIEAVADALAAVASSPAGPVLIGAAAGLSAISRSIALYNAANGSALLTFMRTAKESGPGAGAGLQVTAAGMARVAAGAGILALSLTDLDDQAGASNTAMYSLMGTMILPGWGTAAGAIVGSIMDIRDASEQAEQRITDLSIAIATMTRSELLREAARLKAILTEGAGDPQTFVRTAQALNLVNAELERGPGPASLMANALGQTTGQMRGTSRAAQVLTDDLATLMGFFDRRAAVRSFEASLDQLTKGLRKNSGAWDVNYEKGRQNLELLDATGQGIAQVAEQIENRKARNTFIDDAIADLRQLGRQAGPEAMAQIQKVIRELEHLHGKKYEAEFGVDDRPARRRIDFTRGELERLGLLRPTPKIDADDRPAREKINSTERLLNILAGKDTTPKVDVDTGGARAGISAVESWLNSIDDETVYVNVRRRSYVSGGDQEFDVGGYTGRGHRFDPAGVVHRNEVVLPEYVVRRDSSMLRSRYGFLPGMGDLPGYAGGGRVGRLQSDFWTPSVQSGIVGELESFIMSLTGGGKRLETAFIDASTVIRMELKLRQKWLTEQLEANRKRMEAEREALRSLKEMRRGLAGTVAGTFSSDLFGEDATFASIMGTLSSDAGDAQAFAVALSQLQALGFDGAAFRELAASGNLAAAQQLATLSAADIQALEDRYAQRRIQGQLAGSIAGLDLRDEVRAQTKEARQATREMREAKESLHRVEERLERMEKHAEDNVKATDGVGEDVAKNLNRASGDAIRDRR